ncbi:MAG: caspase family protein [Candidatus Heimdallarchaeaceae archaeon]
MKLINNGNQMVLVIFVILTMSLLPYTKPTSAFYNWVEWDGYVYDDFGRAKSGVIVRLKYGSTTLDSDVTDGNGYYYIKEYADNSNRYTLKASYLSNWTTQEYTNLIGRPEAGGPWRYNFNLDYSDTWALIVGIESYEILTQEKYSDNDADEWNDHLSNSSGLDFNHITVLKNSDAVESSIKSSLENIVSNADEGDIIAFIFSGKGYYNDYDDSYALAAYDALSGDNDEDGDLYDEELTSIINDSIAARVFFFFDCCYAFGMKSALEDLDNEDTFYFSVSADDIDESYYDEDADLRCWTQCFLYYSWLADSPQGYDSSITTDLDDIHDTAVLGYNYYLHQSVDYYNSTQTPKDWNPYGNGFCLSAEGLLA